MEKLTLCKWHQDEPMVSQLEYQEPIRSLQDADTISLPNISYVTGILARYAKIPSLIHSLVVKRFL